MLSDSEITAICEMEISGASGWSSGELANERATAMEYYLGEPYGDEMEARSEFRSREVLETVEWALPSLLRIFMEEGPAVSFEPRGAEDEEQARQETDTCNFVYWNQNPGFINTYTLFKDALLSKNGFMKIWLDDADQEEREEYANLNEVDLAELAGEAGYDRELLESSVNEDGTVNVVFKTKRTAPKICIEACPPEECGANRDARHVDVQRLRFFYHRTRKSRSDLLEMGFDPEIVNSLPYENNIETEERLARRHLTDEQDALRYSAHKSMDTTWVTECYIRVDRNEDEIAELLKVTMATGGSDADSGAKLLDIEEVDRIPFISITPVILTHKFNGLSLADLVLDLQHNKSSLARGIIDSMHLANNQRVGANENVNLSDLMVSRPGGVVRVKGKERPLDNVQPIPAPPPPPDTFQLLEYLDQAGTRRTGAGQDTAMLDPQSLSNVNTGVAALAYDAARAKIELIARIFAEIGFRPMFRMIHELLQKSGGLDDMSLRLNGEYVQVNPSEWRRRENMTINVGMGQSSRERRALALSEVISQQRQDIESGAGGTLVLPEQMYKARFEYSEALGIKEPSLYWQDPALLPPPEPPPPDPQMMILEKQIELAERELEYKQAKLAQDDRKMAMDAQLKMGQMELQRDKDQVVGFLGEMKSSLDAYRTQSDSQLKMLEATTKAEKAEIDSEVRLREVEVREAQVALSTLVDKYKADLSALTDLVEGHLSRTAAIEQQTTEQTAGVSRLVGDLHASVINLNERISQRNAPRRVVRDDDGRIVQIGEAVVRRGPDGLVEEIG